ncbi:MAG: hypothetical protein O7E52_06595 [Candidatus Poribacteria bacterium]|nr:hypothetical protein [Candidatus Poribacteria bacterium]
MNKFVFIITSLLIMLTCVGCYTQLGYYEAPRPTRHTSYQRQDRNEKTEVEQEQPAEIEVEAEASEMDTDTTEEDEGYYGRSKPTYRTYEPYYAPYYYDYYPAYPYYGGYYYPAYPHYGYYSPYYYGYGYRRGRYGHHYDGYYHSRPHSRIGGLHYGRQRSQSYRGVRSGQPSSSRPGRSAVSGKSSRAPARSSSGLRQHRSRRSGRY